MYKSEYTEKKSKIYFHFILHVFARGASFLISLKIVYFLSTF